MDFQGTLNIKQWLLFGGILAGIVAINPVILYKLFNLLSALVAAVIGVVLALFIAVKVLDHAILKYGKSESRRNRDRVVQQNGTVLGADTTRNLGWISRIYLKVVQAYDSVLRGLAKSMDFHHSAEEIRTNNSIRDIQEKIMFLGRSPERGLQAGTYVCVSQNMDMLMSRIFEYTFRDYVETWYSTVSNDRGKLHKLVKADFWEAYQVFSKRLAKVDIINLVMNRYTKTLLQYYKELDETDPEKRNCPASFHLHPCLKDLNSERELLRRVSEYIIRLCFPAHISSNSSSRLILREILAGLVFLPLIDTICDPDYINLSILTYLQNREIAEEDKSRTYTYAATYEDFIRIISNAESVTELRQIHRHIMTELMHATAISSLKKDDKKLGKAKSMAKGELLLSRDLKRYINQCQVARQQCEKRIRYLGGEGSNGNERTFGDRGDQVIASSVYLMTFAEVMGSPMARSYFLKYMKKIGKGSLLKFWSEVDIVRESAPTGKELAKIISHIYQTYIAGGTSDELPFEIDKVLLKGMQTCVVGNKNPDDFFKLQEQVSQILEKLHFPSFVVSNFYIHQLMPQLNEDGTGEDQCFQQGFEDPNQEHTAAFGSRKSVSDTILARLEEIEEKLEYKAQALESLKPQAKHDHKLTRQLEQDIENLQEDKLRQQLHIERTETWWSRMGTWNATVDSVSLLSEEDEHSKIPVYSIIVVCSGVPLYEVTDDVSGWVVTRNLNEFKQLHQSLKEFSPWLKKRRLPSMPVLSFGGLSEKFLERSKTTLNEYLGDILKDEILSRSEMVYAFLSHPPELSKKDGLKRRGMARRPSTTSGFASAFQETAVRKRSLWQIGDLLALPKDILDSILHYDDSSDSDDADNDESLIELDSIATPLYQLISELFEIQGLFRPLRKTLIIFARVAFGGTINKQICDTLQWLVSEPMLTYYLQIFIDSMWPDGQLKPKLQERTEEDKIQTALEAHVKLLQSIPEGFQNLIGQQNSRQGLLKIFQTLQEKQLNKHLFYNLLCETVEEVFPEILKTD